MENRPSEDEKRITLGQIPPPQIWTNLESNVKSESNVSVSVEKVTI